MPKSRKVGETASRLGVRPDPVMVLVELPPLLMKMTALLKLDEFVGAKLTITSPVCPGRMEKLVSPAIENGLTVNTSPVRTRPPAFTI